VLVVAILLIQAASWAVNESFIDSFTFTESATGITFLARGPHDSFTGFLEALTARTTLTRRPSDSFIGFLESLGGTTLLHRNANDSFIGFLESLGGTTLLHRNANDSLVEFLDSAVETTALHRPLVGQSVFQELVSWSSKLVSPDSCADQLATGHTCTLRGTSGHNTFTVDTCLLVGTTCTLSGGDTVSIMGSGVDDTFNVTGGLGSNVYSLIEANGNASFYVDGCNGGNFTASLCTSRLIPTSGTNYYSAIAGGNAQTPDGFFIQDGPGTNYYSLIGGAGPDQFVLYGGPGTDAYALLGGTNSTFIVHGGVGNETYVLTGRGSSVFTVEPGNGTETFSITGGPGSEISISAVLGSDTYNLLT
jgi:hypothetical protein